MKLDFSKSARKWVALIVAVVGYFLIHEGAHLIYALCTGVFKQINFLGLGVQVDVYRDLMSDTQLGIFCLVGAVATILVAYALVIAINGIIKNRSLYFRAIMYYITIAFLLIDPFYLSVIYPFVGGGDMNGIALILPETAARIGFGVIAIINLVLLFKVVLPKYKAAYRAD